jgi:serine/threonine protein kinase
MTALEQPQYLSTCPACEGVLDVTAFEPSSKVVCPRCGQSVRVRRKFDHFVISRQLGEGGMSRVFESEDERLARRVALKILNRHYSRDGARMKQFEREAQLTAAVTHPNVVKVYSVGRDQGNFYIAMELVGGGSLEKRIADQEHLSEAEVLRVGRGVAEGLRAAYREGLIHRDVKPANILFTEDETPKIVDFGLALFHERDVDESGEIWATPFYVAPEKVSDDREDFRSDMYSLGATLYHALVGKPPHQANTNSLAELKAIKSKPVKLEDRGMRFSTRTCELIDRLLELDPEKRFASYDALVEAFRDAESLLAYSQIGSRTRKRKIVSVALGVLAVLVLLAVFMKPSDGAKNKPVRYSQGVKEEDLSDVGKILANGSGTVSSIYANARDVLFLQEGKYAEARKVFDELIKSPVTKAVTRNKARFNAALCAMRKAAEEDADASEIDPRDRDFMVFFKKFGQHMTRTGLGLDVKFSETRYKSTDEEALAYLAHGLAQWYFGSALEAAPWLEAFMTCQPEKGFEWIEKYKKLAAPYVEDLKIAQEFAAKASAKSFASAADATQALAQFKKAIASLKTKGALRVQLESGVTLAESELRRFRLAAQRQQQQHIKEVRQRELAQFSDLNSTLPALVRGYDFSRAVEVLKGVRFEAPEVQSALTNRLYLWSKAQEFMEQLITDVNSAGYSGTIDRKAAVPLQARLSKMSLASVTLTLPRGELVVPLDSVSPDTLVAMAQAFCQTIHDSTDYYRRQELIAVFAKVEGLDQMAHAVAAQLMEENRAFRQRWTRVEQSGS